jgi:hypothetical protein
MVLPELEAEFSTADLTLNLTPACRTDSLRFMPPTAAARQRRHSSQGKYAHLNDSPVMYDINVEWERLMSSRQEVAQRDSLGHVIPEAAAERVLHSLQVDPMRLRGHLHEFVALATG